MSPTSSLGSPILLPLREEVDASVQARRDARWRRLAAALEAAAAVGLLLAFLS